MNISFSTWFNLLYGLNEDISHKNVMLYLILNAFHNLDLFVLLLNNSLYILIFLIKGVWSFSLINSFALSFSIFFSSSEFASSLDPKLFFFSLDIPVIISAGGLSSSLFILISYSYYNFHC